MKRKNMIIIILVVILFLGLLFAFSFPFIVLAHNYSDTIKSDDGFVYLVRDTFKKAGVESYTYDPSSDNKEIIIPEVYEEYPVKGLGGYFGRGAPGPFHVELKGINSSGHVGPSDGSFSWYTEGKNLEYVYYDLVLNIGPNIREIFASQLGIESNGYLHLVRVFVNCASDNPKFYSENGVLYNKDGSIVEGFLYWNQSYR